MRELIMTLLIALISGVIVYYGRFLEFSTVSHLFVYPNLYYYEN